MKIAAFARELNLVKTLCVFSELTSHIEQCLVWAD